MIDLTEITEEVARAFWNRHFAEVDDLSIYENLSPQEKATLKGNLLPTINQTAVLVEAVVRQEIRLKLDLIPRADLGGLTISIADALAVAE